MKNIFKTDRLGHKDPAIRIQAIEAMDASDLDQQKALAGLLGTEPEDAVRHAALQKIDSVQVLLENLGGQQFKPNIINAIESRLIQVLETKGVPEDSLASLLQSTNDVTNALVASHSMVPEQRALVIKSLTEDPLLLRIVSEAKYHDSRMQAAEKLTDESAWKEGVNHCKTRDKAVAKMLQARLDEKYAAEKAEQQSFEEIKTTVESMKSLAASVWSPQHVGKYQALVEKWVNADQTHTVSMSAEFDEAKLAVQALISKHEETLSEEAVEKEVAPSDDIGDEPKPKVLSEQATGLYNKLLQSTLDQLPVVLEQYRSENTQPDDQTQALLAHTASIAVLFDPPFDVNKARPGAIQERIKRVSTLLAPDKTLIPFDLDQAAYFKEFTTHKQALLDRLDKARQESQDRIKATHRQFGALSGLVAAGKWGPANSMMQRLKKKLAAMEPAERNKFSDKLKRSEKQLDEMADWQDFAAKPKLELICSEMEALPAKELKPPALAKEVKRLQESWKALGISRASNELWARFKTAGDTAYEPCKVYFEQRQQDRQVKIDAKNEICSSLDAEFEKVDWAEPDWKAIVKMVSAAKRNWSQNRVTDRKPDKALEQKFSESLLKFESRLGEEFDANAAIKKELIEKAKVLAEGEVNQHNINQIKRLQNTWKQGGVMRRKEDQTLWEEFNGHCRTIFKQHKEIEKEKYKESMGHVFRAKDIIKELRALSKSQNPDDSKIQELSTEFQALEEFPDREKKFLLRDYRSALDLCSKAAASQSRKKVQAVQQELVRQVDLCEQLEALVESKSATDTALEDIDHAWEATDITLPKEMAAKVSKRRDQAMAHIKAGTQYDYNKSEEVRRDLLIKMEIAADIETPEEDKSRRMAYQLQNLRDGMTSSGISDQKKQLRDLEQQWFIAPPVKSELKSNLHSRYLKALGK